MTAPRRQHATIRRTTLALAGVLWAGLASAQTTPPAQTDPAPGASPASAAPREPRQPATARYAERLAALHPGDPQAYFALGEDVAGDLDGPPDRRLAITLFVLAFETSRGVPGAAPVGAASCLALTDLTRDDAERRWLVALAQTTDHRHVPPRWLERTPPAAADSEAYQAALVLGLIRSGDGVRARQLMARPPVAAALNRADTLLRRLGVGGVPTLAREATRWPCPECANQRIQRRGRPDVRLCFHCAGNPGPKLSRNELLAHLRFESWVLQGVQRSWAAQIVVDDGAPLHDPAPDALARVFEVDPRAVYWRNGRWVRSPDGRDPAETEPVRPPTPAPARPAAPATSGS